VTVVPEKEKKRNLKKKSSLRAEMTASKNGTEGKNASTPLSRTESGTGSSSRSVKVCTLYREKNFWKIGM